MTDQHEPSETVGRSWQDTLRMLVSIAENLDWDTIAAGSRNYEIVSARRDHAYLDIVKFCQSEMPIMFERTIDITVPTP